MPNRRDNFAVAVIATLAARAGFRCANPDCRRETSGPASTEGKAVNIGVAGHITAAAPGGPRFDPALTPAQRSAIGNAIWLCQFCGKLIDSDDPRFPTELLHSWKAAAEQRALDHLEHPRRPETVDEPILTIPQSDPAKSPLAFSARATAFVGRDDEMETLLRFVRSTERFSWMLLTGPGGSGKSRLALELCCGLRPEWDAGFLGRNNLFTGWAHFRPERPTLLVIDYLSTRVAEASAMILVVAQSVSYLRAPVRILLAERDIGSWWPRFMREESQAESATISNYQAGEPLSLGPMDSGALDSLAENVAALEGIGWNENSSEWFRARMRTVDRLGRPLFGIMAAYSMDEAAALSPNLLDVVLKKESARRRVLTTDGESNARMENLATLATMVGGLLARSGGYEYLAEAPIAPLLPNTDLMDRELYRDFVSGPGVDATLPGFQPDIVGERIVLNRFSPPPQAESVPRRLLVAAWALQKIDLAGFILRVASDFPDDPGLPLLCDLPRSSDSDRVAWAYLAGDLVRLARYSDNPLIGFLFREVEAMAHNHPGDLAVQNALARAELYWGNVLREEGNYEEALVRYTSGLQHAVPRSEVEAGLLNNKGIVHLELASEEEAFAHFTSVIDNRAAGDEVRACSLNNRADIFARRGRHHDAIRDRSEILELRDTQPDRRYIALARRSKSYLQLGNTEAALEDLTKILNIDDVAPEQKFESRLHRGQLYKALGWLPEAIKDLETVRDADDGDLFSGTRSDALVELADLARASGDFDTTREYLDVVTDSGDTDDRTLVESLVVWARTLSDMGCSSDSAALWRSVLDNPSSTQRQRALAAQSAPANPEIGAA